MARTNLLQRILQYPWNPVNAALIKAKVDEHDSALDDLENTSDYKTSVRFATTANINLATTALTAIDGVTPVAGDRALVKNQSTAKQNGIYVASASAWSRASDADATGDMTSGMQVFVSEGTANGGKWYLLTTADPIVVGTDAIAFTEQPNAADLASHATGKGASLIGIEDASPGYFTATEVEAALREIWTKIILKTTPGGASYIGLFDNAGIFDADNVEAALAEVKTIADAGIALAKKTVTVDESELSNASQAVNIGTALPENAIVLGHEIVVNEDAAGQSDLTITIGGTDADAIVASTDLDALSDNPGKYQGTLGVHPKGSFSTEQLVATFAATDLGSLTTGNWTITVWYSVLA
jgi:hypothetical protein